VNKYPTLPASEPTADQKMDIFIQKMRMASTDSKGRGPIA